MARVQDEPEMDAQVEQAPTNDWTIAALAHASILLLLILGSVGGVGTLVGPAVALALYMGYRYQSRYVAFQALQAFVYQVTGMLVGLPAYILGIVILVVGVVVSWLVSGLLSVVLVGFLLMPFALLITLVLVLWAVVVPIAWIGYGVYGAFQAYQGNEFRYWLIGEALEREVRL